MYDFDNFKKVSVIVDIIFISLVYCNLYFIIFFNSFNVILFYVIVLIIYVMLFFFENWIGIVFIYVCNVCLFFRRE